MRRPVRVIAVAAILAGCGGGFSDADARSAQDSVRDALDALELCAPPAASCDAAQVRADVRAIRCSDSSLLSRHGRPVPDGGLEGCRPR